MQKYDIVIPYSPFKCRQAGFYLVSFKFNNRHVKMLSKPHRDCGSLSLVAQVRKFITQSHQVKYSRLLARGRNLITEFQPPPQSSDACFKISENIDHHQALLSDDQCTNRQNFFQTDCLHQPQRCPVNDHDYGQRNSSHHECAGLPWQCAHH